MQGLTSFWEKHLTTRYDLSGEIIDGYRWQRPVRVLHCQEVCYGPRACPSSISWRWWGRQVYISPTLLYQLLGRRLTNFILNWKWEIVWESALSTSTSNLQQPTTLYLLLSRSLHSSFSPGCAKWREHSWLKISFMVFSVVWQPMVTTIAGTRVAMSTADVLKAHRKGLEAGLTELAVTGRAFNELCHTGNMNQFLFYTRIFARFTPEDKVDCGDYWNWKFIRIQLGKSLCTSQNLIKHYLQLFYKCLVANLWKWESLNSS